MKTLVIQSQNPTMIVPWMKLCMESVQTWATSKGFDYQFLGEELFDPLPDWILVKTKNRRIVATDLARLIAMRSANLTYDMCIWCDADFLVFNQNGLDIDQACSRGFGREVWIELDAKERLRARRKVHNAFMFFESGDPFLDFYIEAATKMMMRVEGEMVPQFIGPKFLTSLHNMMGLEEVEGAGMFSPLVLRDILNEQGPAMDLMRNRQKAQISGANLSASYVNGEDSSALTINEMASVAEILLSHGDRMFPDC